ncbi:hypothetical protein [Gynuella sunshinyii]|uniref:hypothetical protein n=1 Tax=Gynuella sunshinyii TaxID=1445505 RepID=UPI0005CBBC85|nr:hypothetical protein [Gynuella sunshinyii]
MPNPLTLKRILLNRIVFAVFMGTFLSPCFVGLVDVIRSANAEQIYSSQQQSSKKIATTLVPISNGMQLATWYQSDDNVVTDRRITLRHQSEGPAVQTSGQKQSFIWPFVVTVVILLMLIFLFGYCIWRLNMLRRSLMTMIYLWE